MAQWLYRISPCPKIVGDQWSAAGWVEPLRVIYDHELVLFADGDFVVDIEDRKIPCPAGAFVIVPPGRRHASRTLSPKGGHRYWVHFDWTWTKPRVEAPTLTYLPGETVAVHYRPAPAFVPLEVLHGTIASPRRVIDLHRQLSDLWNRGGEHERLLARARLLELLLELLAARRPPEAVRGPEHDLPHRVRTTLDRIAQRPVADMPSIQRCLEELGYGYAHLCRRFRQAYGLAPLQYINALRIERAKFLVHDTALPLAEVARRVGYSSPAYFCRQFRRHVGQSPSDYARSIRLTPDGTP